MIATAICGIALGCVSANIAHKFAKKNSPRSWGIGIFLVLLGNGIAHVVANLVRP